MSSLDIKSVFIAQTDNVRELESAWTHVNRSINQAYKTGNLKFAHFQTRMLGLIFCAYAEATFSKLIHTPNGLDVAEIEQIKEVAKRDIVQSWHKCVELATAKINSSQSNHVPNIRQKLTQLIDTYVKEPSLIRNKIAHGQWAQALNRDNTQVNSELTTKIHELNVVDLYRYKCAFTKLSAIVEDIIESPTKAHWKFYWTHISDFETEQKRMANWTLEDKIRKMKAKKEYHQKE